MRDSLDRYEIPDIPTAIAGHKRLGSYLVEAGLLSRAQIDVALNDQQATGMKFGEILAARGWVKQQTVDYLMKKVVEPERQALKPRPRQELKSSPNHEPAKPSTPATASQSEGTTRPPKRPPIRKPLPSVSPDQDVTWVG